MKGTVPMKILKNLPRAVGRKSLYAEDLSRGDCESLPFRSARNVTLEEVAG